MVVRRAEIEVHIAAVINVAVVLLGADERWLRKEGPVVVAARVLFTVGKPGNVALFIAAHALFAGPQRERFTAQIEIRELLAAAVNMIGWLRRQPQPETIVRDGVVFEPQHQTIVVISAYLKRGTDRLAARKANHPARSALADGRLRQGDFLIEPVFNAEVAAEHLDIRCACARPQAGCLP
ncbi:hypothetical protein BN128_3223 [Cronobacter sakazakii 696]|nr:hypothetical protein BN128_3223 [Cronobacter sakazakii 696]